MKTRMTVYTLIALLGLALPILGALETPAAAVQQTVQDTGVVRIKSSYGFAETVQRVRQDIAAKGIMSFAEIDQARLAADASIALAPSTLLVFGNPALGTQFITSNPDAGLDWPVRLLVTQDSDGAVWMVYTDFGFIARRHAIADRAAAFAKASEVIASITASAVKD